MSIRVHVGGRVSLPDEASVSVFDRGFLYGDSVYETLCTENGHPVALEEHLDRLERSSRRIRLRPVPREEIKRALADTLAAAGNAESRIRIVVSRGVGTLDLDPSSAPEPALVVFVGPRGEPSAELYERGVSVAVVSVTRNHPNAIDPAVKSGNYLNNVLALEEARRCYDAHEAILLAPGGSVAEGASSNVFLVTGGRVRTPATNVGILDGVTRAKVLALCDQAGILAEEVTFLPPADLEGADEVFLTSSVRGVLPVTKVGDKTIGDGMPGPITRRLQALYLEHTRQAP